MKRKVIGIVAAIALASVGTIVLVSYVQSARTDAAAEGRTVRVWAVKRSVPKGTDAAAIKASVGQISVPRNLVANGAVTDLKRLKGLVTNSTLVSGEQLVAGRFETPTVVRQGDVPKGLLQVTVKLDPERALGGRVRVGDTVGVLLSTGKDRPADGRMPSVTVPTGGITDATHLQLHKVLVTSVLIAGNATGATSAAGTDNTDPKKKDTLAAGPTDALLVTLALDAPSVEKVVYASEFGTVWLSNEPADAPEGGTQIVTPGVLYTQPAAAR